MNKEWIKFQGWIAHFDILGLKSVLTNKSATVYLATLRETISEIIEILKNDVKKFDKNIDYVFYADTFLIYSKTADIADYPAIISASKRFIIGCITKLLPIRGAISYGEIIFGHDKKIIMGEAFLESFVYGEDQNWLGLILTPSASKKLKKHNFNPCRHGFINKDIPMRKFSIFDNELYAYYFINGSTNYKCPLLPMLEEMQLMAPNTDKVKYKNTIKFIEKYYKVHKRKLTN